MAVVRHYNRVLGVERAHGGGGVVVDALVIFFDDRDRLLGPAQSFSCLLTIRTICVMIWPRFERTTETLCPNYTEIIEGGHDAASNSSARMGAALTIKGGIRKDHHH